MVDGKTEEHDTCSQKRAEDDIFVVKWLLTNGSMLYRIKFTVRFHLKMLKRNVV